jgi:hypothetical protein
MRFARQFGAALILLLLASAVLSLLGPARPDSIVEELKNPAPVKGCSHSTLLLADCAR